MSKLKVKVSKIITSVFFAGVGLALIVNPTLAHVSVKPAEVGMGAYQTFSVSVPNEKDMATVRVRLLIPEGLESVMPNVKPGWMITVSHAEDDMKSEEDHHGSVTEIVWSGGTIPVGQRDEFAFSAKTPSQETDLIWKAYQTYSDGTIVSWDLGKDDTQPKDKDGKSDFSKVGPASYTKIVNDLEESANAINKSDDRRNDNSPAIMISLFALALSGISLLMSSRRKTS